MKSKISIRSISLKRPLFQKVPFSDARSSCPYPYFRKSLMSISFPPAILGPEMAALILWAPGVFGSFCWKGNPCPYNSSWSFSFGRGGGSAMRCLGSKRRFCVSVDPSLLEPACWERQFLSTIPASVACLSTTAFSRPLQLRVQLRSRTWLRTESTKYRNRKSPRFSVANVRLLSSKNCKRIAIACDFRRKRKSQGSLGEKGTSGA